MILAIHPSSQPRLALAVALLAIACLADARAEHADRLQEAAVEGQAGRVEVDSVANEVRLIGAASLRNLNGTVVTQSVQGEPVTCDTARDKVSSTRAAQRARVVFAPTVTSGTDATPTR